MKIFSALIILLFLLVKDLSAQSLIVDDSVKLNRGVYLSFEEFKFNAPSVMYPDFMVEVKERKIKTSVGKRYEQYRLIFDTPVPFNEDRIWGFCDGKDVFIRGEDEFFGKNNYDKIVYMGRYCCFYRFRQGPPIPIYGNTGAPMYSPVHYPARELTPRLININNGIDTDIDNKTMKLILSQDEGLLKEFKGDKLRKERYFYYLINYSELHKNEIKR